MTCQSCKEKKIKQWTDRGKSEEWAEQHYKTVIEPHLPKPKKRQYYIKYLIFFFFLRIDFVATFLWTLRRKHLTLIGRGHNPDYTIPCNSCPTGDCSVGMEDCSDPWDCRHCPSTTCSSPPIPHSTCTNICICSPTQGCDCREILHIPTCVTKVGEPIICALSGVCNCNCDAGYYYDPITKQCLLLARKAGLHPSKVLSILLDD